MIDQKSFLTMRGVDILTFLRDSIADEAWHKAVFIADCEAVAGGSTDPELRQRVRALKAIADALQFLISFGLEERLLCEKDKHRVFPEWISRCANQARQALVEEVPDTEDQPTG